VTPSPQEPPPAVRLRPAIVLSTTEDDCTVVDGDGRTRAVPYAQPFPRPRTDRVTPGNLVAIATAPDGSQVVVWRWFDAVVLDQAVTALTLWEPQHGQIIAQVRDPQHAHRPGSRVYVSAGLPGADWWVAGPAVVNAKDADVEFDQVRDFFTSHSLWDQLT
jgi:hypothetical protein